MTEAIPTTERLAKALEEAGAPKEMIDRARAGYYDDFKSELALPCVQLVNDLRAAGLHDLERRAMDGEFDGSAEESAAWFEAEGKEHLSPAMWHIFGDYPKPGEPDYPRQRRTRPRGFA